MGELHQEFQWKERATSSTTLHLKCWQGFEYVSDRVKTRPVFKTKNYLVIILNYTSVKHVREWEKFKNLSLSLSLLPRYLTGPECVFDGNKFFFIRKYNKIIDKNYLWNRQYFFIKIERQKFLSRLLIAILPPPFILKMVKFSD